MNIWRYALAGVVFIGGMTALLFGSLSDPRTTTQSALYLKSPPPMPSMSSVVAPSTAAPPAPVLRDEYKIEELLRQMDALRAQVAHAVKEFEQARQAVQQSAQPIP